jgi:large subunit ribosomal protein L30
MKTSQPKQLKIQLIRSLSGRIPNHIACANGLGLRRIHQVRVIEDTQPNRGMINKISYLLKVEELV